MEKEYCEKFFSILLEEFDVCGEMKVIVVIIKCVFS